jgi:anti-anti-sigma factor
MTRPPPDEPDVPAPATDAVAAVEVALTGELDLATYEQAQERVAAAERGRPALLVIDLAALEFMDSSGVRLVLRADHRAREQGRRVAVRLGTGGPMRVFQTLGLLDVLDVLPEPGGDGADGGTTP